MKINWFGLAAEIITLIVLVISLYLPWWQLTIGTNLITVYASPININFSLFGAEFTLPIIWALNLVGILTFATSGLIMLLYSLIPTRSYSKELLGFSYKKPIYALITFVAGLLAVVGAAGFIGLTIPLMGSSNLALTTQFMPMGISISGLISGSFQLPFWLAIVAAVLCVAARLYHGRVAKAPITEPAKATSTTETAATDETA